MKRGKQTCKILKDIRRQIAEANDIEFITLEKIYLYLHCEYGFNIHSIRNNINYALSNRNKNLSVKNFEKVFGYEYYERNFEPKLFIEEVSNLIKRFS